MSGVESHLATSLGLLRPDTGVGAHELDEALKDVRAAVDGGQPEHTVLGAFAPPLAKPSVHAGAGARTPELQAVGRERREVSGVLVNVRTTAIEAGTFLNREWTHGLRPSATRGPFVNEFGGTFWIDTFALPYAVTVEVMSPIGGARVLARLPLLRGRPDRDSHALSRGSVWLSARLLDPSRADDEFVGMRVDGGRIELTGATGQAGARITLQPQWSMQLELQLDLPPLAEPTAGVGLDATNANVELPRKVTLTLSATRPARIDFEPASIEAFGTRVQLRRSPAAPVFDPVSRYLVFPCERSRSEFGFEQVRSGIFSIARSATIESAGWALPLTRTVPDALGEAEGAGAMWLRLVARLRLGWEGLREPAAANQAVMVVSPASVMISASLAPTPVRHTLRLWDEKAHSPPRACSVDVTSAAGSLVLFLSRPGIETVAFSGVATPHLDRPLQADGGRTASSFPTSWLLLTQREAEITATVIAIDSGASTKPHVAFALENALLKTRPPDWLHVTGLCVGDRILDGRCVLRFPLRTVLPTLPDPYVANCAVPRTDAESGWVTTTISWPEPGAASLAFSSQAALASASSMPLYGKSMADFARGQAPCVLLDVSSNADQFGIAVPIAARKTTLDGMSVVTSANETPVITLPPISWEPMLTKAPSVGSGDLVLPPPPNDGGPAAVLSQLDSLRPANPVSMLSAHFSGIREHRHFSARLPLPFGLIANLDTREANPASEHAGFLPEGGRVYLNRPVFPGGLTGARQLGFRGAPRKLNSEDKFIDAVMPGRMELVGAYAQAVLSTNIHTQFGLEFGPASPQPRIPLRHYELSGYAASLFSDWRNTIAIGPAIIQARFDVLMGRAAHEVIQVQSILYPWFVRVTRTILIDRTRGGWVLREDTGWVAASDGLFEYPAPHAEAFEPSRRHLGAIVGIQRVRNIRLQGPQFPIPAPATANSIQWQPVLFDADVRFAEGASPRLVVAAGSASASVPARGTSGWIQIGGPTYDEIIDGKPVPLTQPATGPHIFDLFKVAGPARAPLSCTLHLGGAGGEPGMVFRASGIEVSCDDNPAIPRLVVAARGSPALPRDGAWSLARMAATDAAPSALDPAFPIPLVRPNGAAGSNRWHLADPADILRLGDTASPVMRYGLVQSLGAQKLFFGRPRVDDDADPLSVPQPPQLADMGALLHAAGVFPGLADAFDLPTLRKLSVTGGELGFTDTFPIAAGRKALLVDLGGPSAIQVLIEYHDENEVATTATVQVDPAASPRWSVLLDRVCFAVTFKGAKLISIYARVVADELNAPTVKDLCVHYGGMLNALQTIFSNVQQVARFLPGGSNAGLKIGFSQGRLSVQNAFALPKLPLGAGQITDVSVQMGFDVALSPFDVRFLAGLGSPQKPFRWIVSPLAGTGVVQVGVGTGGLDILIQAGLGLGLAIDLGIASGSASIALAMEMNTFADPFELRGILSGRASVDVLQGLASATITLAAGLGFIPPPQLFQPPFMPPQLLPPPDEIPELTVGLTASVMVGIHVSVCWVVDVDFEGYWQFRQDITTPAIPIPV